MLAIFQKPILSASKRIQVMLLHLQNYNIKLEYHSGKEIIIADTLSRAPIEGGSVEDIQIYAIREETFQLNEIELTTSVKISEDRLEYIKRETQKDPALCEVISYISSSWPESIKRVSEYTKEYYKFKDELTEQNGLVIRGEQIVIPRHIRKMMIEKVHMGHQGMVYSTKLAKSSLFWTGMSKQIADKNASCDPCMKYSASNSKEEMLSHEIPAYPQQVISMDICEWEGEIYLVSVCHYSDFIEVNKIKDMRASTLIM